MIDVGSYRIPMPPILTIRIALALQRLLLLLVLLSGLAPRRHRRPRGHARRARAVSSHPRGRRVRVRRGRVKRDVLVVVLGHRLGQIRGARGKAGTAIIDY